MHKSIQSHKLKFNVPVVNGCGTFRRPQRSVVKSGLGRVSR